MIDRRHSKLGRRLWLSLGAATAVAALVAALAGTGAAQTGGTELHLVGTSQKTAGFFPKGRPRPGSQIGFGDKIVGDDSGVSRAVCTIVGGPGDLPCTIWVKLSKGTLEFQGMLPEKARNAPIAVVGGTGRYNGARGTAYATDEGKNKTSVVVDLLP